MSAALEWPISRRRLMFTGTAAGVASLLVPITVLPSRAQSAQGPTYDITDWISIASTGEVTLGLSQPEVGQGSYTVLPQILADELDADWQHINVRFVTGKDAYKYRLQKRGTGAEGGCLDVDDDIVRASAHSRGSRARGAPAHRGRDMGS